MNPNKDTSFGFDRLSLYKFIGGAHVGTLELPGSLSVEAFVRDLKKTEAGRSVVAASARLGRSGSDGSFTVDQCPAWLKAEATGATLTNVAASSLPQALNLNDIVGSMSTSLIVTLSAEASTGAVVNVKATASGATVTINPTTGNARTLTLATLDTTARSVGSGTGISLSRSAVDNTHPAFNVNDELEFTIQPAAAGGTDMVAYKSTDHPEYLKLLAFSNEGGPDDFVEVLEIHKILLGGIAMKMQDDEVTSEVEVSFAVVEPYRADGEYARTYNHKKL